MNTTPTLQPQSNRARRPAAQAPIRFMLPKVSDSIWIGLFLFVSQMGQKMMNGDGDLGRHLTIGSVILSSGQVPLHDLFSHTMLGQPLTPHEWLAQVFFALFYRWWGFPGVTLLDGLVIATTFWLVYQTARNFSGSLSAALLVTVMAVFASLLHWLSRPHLFTFLMLALWVRELETLRGASGDGRLSGQRWWIFPLIMLLWANLHGAFIAGFVTWGLYGAGVAVDRWMGRGATDASLPGRAFWSAYLLAGASSLLVTLLNPSGLGLWGTSVGYLGNTFLVDMTVEYRSPNFHSLSAQPFLVLIGLTVALFGLQRRKLPAAHVVLSAAWMVMALYSARNIPLFAIVSAPALARLLADGFVLAAERWKSLRGLWNMDQGLLKLELTLRGFLYPLLSALWAVSMLAGANTAARTEITYDPEVFPVEAVDWLAEHPQEGNGFNEFTWGGYLLYRLWPEQRVFIDGQTDFYGEALTRAYLQVSGAADGWEAVLEQYQVDWAIIPSGGPLAGALREHLGWQSVYRDGTAEIFIRE